MILGCKWTREADTLPFEDEKRKAIYEHHVACAPQHDDGNQECPHNSDGMNPCLCTLTDENGNEDTLGWELKWSNPPAHDFQFDRDGKERASGLLGLMTKITRLLSNTWMSRASSTLFARMASSSAM